MGEGRPNGLEIASTAAVALNHGMSNAAKSTKRLPEPEWRARMARHRERVGPWVEAHLLRRARQEKHPVYDFLFQYYAYAPRALLRWSPGMDGTLEGEGARAFLEDPRFVATPEGVTLDEAQLPTHRLQALHWVVQLLEATAARPPRLGCFGLHEWAMVYRAEQRRHDQLPLRVSQDVLNELVENQPVVCSHYDAFRFFTQAARPLNRLTPARQDRADWEQPGCLHANMDLYKHAFRLSPLVPSELVADCFDLAWRVRDLDMRASPYDLSDHGYSPIAIETPEGKVEYAEAQRAFADQAGPLRATLIKHCEHLLRSKKSQRFC